MNLNNMMKVHTLIDITETKKHRNNSSDKRAVDQQANFMTFAQTLMLRKNVFFESPKIEERDAKELGFGSDYEGTVKVWTVTLSVDEGQYLPEASSYVEDFDLVPVISGLNESIKINNNVFRTKGKSKNIVFKANIT